MPSDLGWPISLLDLTIGFLATVGSSTPIYICGYEAGYEQTPYPGLYDPRNAGGRSPLFSALEPTRQAHVSAGIDLWTVPPPVDRIPRHLIASVGRAAGASAEPNALIRLLRQACWATLASTTQALPTAVLARHRQRMGSVPVSRLSVEDQRVVKVVRAELSARADGDQVAGSRSRSRLEGAVAG